MENQVLKACNSGPLASIGLRGRFLILSEYLFITDQIIFGQAGGDDINLLFFMTWHFFFYFTKRINSPQDKPKASVI